MMLSSQADARNEPACPRCGATTVLPLSTEPARPTPHQEAEEDQVLLGGCCILGDQPQWQCQACGHQWSGRR